MEAQAYIKYIKISPKKVRFIIDDIKKMSPRDALNSLFYSPKRSAKVLYKVIKSAIDNAKTNLKTDEQGLKFKTILVEQGPALKRMRPGSKGRANLYKRRSSHIKVILTNVTVKTDPTKKSIEKADKPAKEDEKIAKKPAQKKSLLVNKEG